MGNSESVRGDAADFDIDMNDFGKERGRKLEANGEGSIQQAIRPCLPCYKSIEH